MAPITPPPAGATPRLPSTPTSRPTAPAGADARPTPPPRPAAPTPPAPRGGPLGGGDLFEGAGARPGAGGLPQLFGNRNRGAAPAGAATPQPGAQPPAAAVPQRPAAPATRPTGEGEAIAGRTDVSMDGQLMTTANQGTSHGTGVAPGALPGGNGRSTVLYVNGIRNTAAEHQGTLRAIEAATGQRAAGLYNATEGFWADTNQVTADRTENTARANGTWAGQSRNAATRSLADSIVNHLTTREDGLQLMAHSQGAVITANALYEARQQLVNRFGEPRANEMMQRLRVETFGGAAQNYVNGPRDQHWLNQSDNVTGGMGPTAETGGQGATFRRFNTPGTLGHNFQEFYLPERQRELTQQRGTGVQMIASGAMTGNLGAVVQGARLATADEVLLPTPPPAAAPARR